MFQLICRILIALILITGTAIGKNYDNIIVVKKMSKSIKDGNTIITKSVSFEARTVKLKKDIFKIEDIGVISLHPNPAIDYIEISFSNKGLQPFENGGEIAIFDVLGNKINYSTPPLLRNATPQEGNFKIDISHLSQGVYFVRIGGNIEKFIKN